MSEWFYIYVVACYLACFIKLVCYTQESLQDWLGSLFTTLLAPVTVPAIWIKDNIL